MLRNETKLLLLFFTFFCLTLPSSLFAHCDTLNGPVVADANRALNTGQIMPVLKWVKKEDETEIKTLFQKVLEVRDLNRVAKELADQSFFETVVRLHRAAEKAPFTGLTSEALPPVLVEADRSLQTGSLDVLLKMILSGIEAQLQQKFQDALEKKGSADQGAEKGRDYVEAYVTFVHYVEALHQSTNVQEGHSH